MTNTRSLVLGPVAVAILAVLAAWFVVRFGVGPDLLRSAAHIPDSAESVDGIVGVISRLQKPMLVVAAAMVPLIIIGGGLMFAIGNRHGLRYIAAAAGVMCLFASVTPIAE